jgi:hypothetical protein
MTFKDYWNRNSDHILGAENKYEALEDAMTDAEDDAFLRAYKMSPKDMTVVANQICEMRTKPGWTDARTFGVYHRRRKELIGVTTEARRHEFLLEYGIDVVLFTPIHITAYEEFGKVGSFPEYVQEQARAALEPKAPAPVV